MATEKQWWQQAMFVGYILYMCDAVAKARSGNSGRCIVYMVFGLWGRWRLRSGNGGKIYMGGGNNKGCDGGRL
jgi:hypothetical protein